MKITTLILFFAIMQVSATTLAQKVTIKANGAALSSIFDQISTQTGYDFAYTTKTLESAKPVTINVKNAELSKVLEDIFKDQPLVFTIKDKFVTVTIKEPIEKGKNKSVIIDKINVRGRVIDEQLRPIEGATIQIKNSGISTITDAKGEFRLKEVEPHSIILISFVGYTRQEVQALEDLNDIVLVLATNELDAVKVIAYGQTTNRLSVGNISSVSSKEIEKQPVGNPLLALEGRVPGLQITQSTGVPGGGVTVRIQGLNSINNGNDPLYVIDGVPYNSQNLNTNTAGILGSSGGPNSSANGSGNPMNYINPDDIESISILKDADATSIYGSRAANGALLITTKKGKPGSTQVNFNIKQGVGHVTKFIDELNTKQYLQMRHTALNNDGQIAPSSTDYDINGLWDTTRFTNWQKILIGNNSQYADYNVSISGGTSNTQFLISGTYHRETTVFPGSFNDQKGSLHFSINNTSENQKFKIQLSGNYLLDNNQLPLTDLTSSATSLAPNAPTLYKDDGTPNWEPNSAGGTSWSNPVTYLMQPFYNKTNNLILNSIISYNIVRGLEVKASLGNNYQVANQFQGSPLSALPPDYQVFSQNMATYSSQNINSWIVEPQIHYQNNLFKGKIDLLIGSTIQQQTSKGDNITGQGYNSETQLEDIHAASTIIINSSINSLYKYNAIYGRLNYNINDKYLLNITARRDGSSRFGIANEFHDFESVGAAWIFSEENFIKKLLPFMSYGKLRGSFGTTGNDQIVDYQYLSLYSSVNTGIPYQGSNGLAPNNLSNPYLQWETTKKLQVGADIGFINDRILLTANFVQNRSSNQLLGYNLPFITGFGSITENFPATVQNTAWEFSASTINLRSKYFSWKTNFNLTLPKNKLIAFPGIENSSYSSSLIIGQPIGIRKVFAFAGVDPQTGAYQFYGKDGKLTFDPQYGTDDYKIIDPSPRYYGGLSNDITYKSFTLSFLIQFSKQQTSNLVFGDNFYPPGRKLQNEPVSILKAWQKPGDITSIQRFTQNFDYYNGWTDAQNSDAAFTSMTTYRLKNISLSYILPDSFLKKMNVKTASIQLDGQNLITVTSKKFIGLDPETGLNLPPLRIISLGLKVGL